MTELYSNVPTFRLTRDASIDNVNMGDNAWLKIIKKKNELAKVELMNRSFIDTTNNTVYEIGFPQFTLSTSPTIAWTQPQSTNIRDISGNDNIIILDFEDLDSRNFLNGETDKYDSLPILKYLVVRLTDSVENLPVGNNQYYNYIFSGDIIGPSEFLDFNTNYCIKNSEILEKDFNGNPIWLYYPLNWCSIINDDINSYLDLNLNVQISPKYYDDSSIDDDDIITSTNSSIFPTTDNSNTYELNNLFWCSLNSERHSKVLFISTGDNVMDIIENQTAVDPTSIPSYTGTAYGIQVSGKYAYRHIPNFVYVDIKVIYNGTEKTHIGNKGGGYRKTPGTLELVRETTEPYYFDNSPIFESSTSTNIWSMRDALEANYFEIRYKPLVPIKPLTSGTGTLSITFKFGNNNPDLPNSTVTTFERYPDMDGTPSTSGTTYKDATRDSESIKLEWKSDDTYPTREQKIILFDVASGTVNQEASIIKTTTNYNDIQSTTFNIQTYVYQFRLEDPTTQNSLKLYNSAIKNFAETNTNIMVINNNKFNLFLFPEIDRDFTNNIFDYDEDNENIGIIQYDPLIDTNNIFSVEMKLEKIFMNDGLNLNADNLLGDTINTELLQSKKIYISGRDTTTSAYSNADGTYDENSPSIDIRFDTNVSDNLTISRSCVSLGKGLVNNNSLNTEDAFINENSFSFSFLFKLKQNFLSDYWKINTTLSELVTDNIIDDSFDDLERQRKIAGTILVIDLYLSGQIFLINTAKNKSDISYIPTITDTIKPSITGNPTLNFDFIENIPALSSHPVYLKLFNNYSTSTENPIDIKNTFYNESINNIYTGNLSNTITDDQKTINQPLNKTPNTATNTTTNTSTNTTTITATNTTTNIFDINTIFSNNTDTYTITIELTTINEAEGVQVSQGTNVGVLQTALSGNVTSITIAVVSGLTWVTDENMIIGGTPIASSYIQSVISNGPLVDKTPSTNTTPTPYNGIYYFDIQSSDNPLSNPTLKNLIIYPGTIQVNLVELPDIIYDPDETKLRPDNKSIIISWPRYYFDNSQGKITWTIVRQDMATLVEEEPKYYDRNSTEISIVGDKIQFIDTKIRIYDKYQYTVSGEFVYEPSINVNTIPKTPRLSLSITGFTTDTIFVCSGYTNRFPFGRFNTTSTNFKLFAPKLLRTDITPTTKKLFASQLLLTNPAPPGVTDEYHLENNITSWPGGRGSCGDNVIISGQNTQVNENIYANTSDQLSKKQIYNFLSKSRFRPDR